MTSTSIIERRRAAVRIVTELYAERAKHLLDQTSEALQVAPERSFVFVASAARAVCEWISLAWELGDHPDLLDVWRRASVHASPADGLSKAHELLHSCEGVERQVKTGMFSLRASELCYFSDARRDLQEITSLRWRDVPTDEYDDPVDHPPGFQEVILRELQVIAELKRMEHEEMMGSFFGDLLRHTTPELIEDLGIGENQAKGLRYLLDHGPCTREAYDVACGVVRAEGFVVLGSGPDPLESLRALGLAVEGPNGWSITSKGLRCMHAVRPKRGAA